MPRISVIMPVYNSEEYLESAIQSVINQTFIDWELILIDDGSLDNSWKICSLYAERDTRIKVIHQDNCGIGKTRNRGLSEAQGEYIAFLDNDDCYDNNMLRINYEAIQKYEADYVKCGVNLKHYDKQGELFKIEERTVSDKMVLLNEHIYQHYFMLKNSLVLNTIWNGLYRAEFLKHNSIRFREDIRWGYDDQIFNFELLRFAHTLVVIPEKLYTWQIRSGHSTSQKADVNRLEEIYEMYQCEEKLICDTMSEYKDSHQWYIRVGYYVRYSIVALAKIDGISWNACKYRIGAFYRYPIFHFKALYKQLPSIAMNNPEHAFIILLLFIRWKKIAFKLTKHYIIARNYRK